MKKKIKIYIIEFILLVFIGIFNIMLAKEYSSSLLLINIFFCLGLTSLAYFQFGYVKDNNYLKKATSRVVIVMILIYFLVTYLSGFFLGFMRNPNLNGIFGTAKILLLYILTYASLEVLRYIILKQATNKIQIIILTIELIILNISMAINGLQIGDLKILFIVTTTIVLPVVASETLYSFITYKISLIPSLIMKLAINLYIYLVPFLPSLGNYLTAVIELMIPFMTFLEVHKILKYKEKYERNHKIKTGTILASISVTFLLILVSLTSGLFKHELVAIISGSMSPVYNRGDAVIITKKDAKEIKIGDILAFNTGTGIVTHRVINISVSDDVFTFTTKGDANTVKDSYEIHNKNVIGTVDYVIKNAGYPTVWITELFERS